MQWELNVQGWDHTAHSKGPNRLEMRQSSREGSQATPEVGQQLARSLVSLLGLRSVPLWRPPFVFFAFRIYNSDSEQS